MKIVGKREKGGKKSDNDVQKVLFSYFAPPSILQFYLATNLRKGSNKRPLQKHAEIIYKAVKSGCMEGYGMSLQDFEKALKDVMKGYQGVEESKEFVKQRNADYLFMTDGKGFGKTRKRKARDQEDD